MTRGRELLGEIPGAVVLDQFSNHSNTEIHRRTTAIEIREDTNGAVEIFGFPAESAAFLQRTRRLFPRQ